MQTENYPKAKAEAFQAIHSLASIQTLGDLVEASGLLEQGDGTTYDSALPQSYADWLNGKDLAGCKKMCETPGRFIWVYGPDSPVGGPMSDGELWQMAVARAVEKVQQAILEEDAPLYDFIDQVPDKTARTLTRLKPSDPYNKAIARAAQVMVNNQRGDWLYSTQWSGGTTCWRTPNGERTCTVDSAGVQTCP